MHKHHAEASPITFRHANHKDVDLIVALVNSAYRGDASRVGWTTEADILGGQRTDADEILGLLEADGSMILLGLQGPEVVGSVHLQKEGEQTYLGMFAIKPGLQGAGIGKQFLQKAEHIARQELRTKKMLMTVISLRHELIAFYERRGYRCTDELKPFPTSERFGVPKVPVLRLAVLEKELEATLDIKPGASA